MWHKMTRILVTQIKLVQFCHITMVWFDTFLITCLDLFKLVQNYTTWLHEEITSNFEQTADKVAQDDKAIPRTTFDKRAAKNQH